MQHLSNLHFTSDTNNRAVNMLVTELNLTIEATALYATPYCHVIAIFGFDGARALLDLDDSDLAEFWPQVTLSRDDRQFLRTTIAEHYANCDPCQRITSTHRRLDRAIDRSLKGPRREDISYEEKISCEEVAGIRN